MESKPKRGSFKGITSDIKKKAQAIGSTAANKLHLNQQGKAAEAQPGTEPETNPVDTVFNVLNQGLLSREFMELDMNVLCASKVRKPEKIATFPRGTKGNDKSYYFALLSFTRGSTSYTADLRLVFLSIQDNQPTLKNLWNITDLKSINVDPTADPVAYTFNDDLTHPLSLIFPSDTSKNECMWMIYQFGSLLNFPTPLINVDLETLNIFAIANNFLSSKGLIRYDNTVYYCPI